MGDPIRDIKEKANKFATKGQTRKAILAYESLLKHVPGDSRTLHRLGELWAKQGDRARAIDYLLQAAYGYLEEGFADRAVAVCRQALGLNPNQESANELLIDALVAKHLENDAVRHLLARAAAFEKSGLEDKQRAALERALALAPQDPDVQRLLAHLNHPVGQPQAVERQAAEPHQAEPPRAEPPRTEPPRVELPQVEPPRAELPQAIPPRAVRPQPLGPDDLEGHQQLAEHHLAQGEYDQAREILKRAMVLKSDNLRTLSLVARACMGQGDRAHAIVTLKRMLRLARNKGNIEAVQAAQASLDEIRKEDPESGEH